jgi:hypothetical protein
VSARLYNHAQRLLATTATTVDSDCLTAAFESSKPRQQLDCGLGSLTFMPSDLQLRSYWVLAEVVSTLKVIKATIRKIHVRASLAKSNAYGHLWQRAMRKRMVLRLPRKAVKRLCIALILGQSSRGKFFKWPLSNSMCCQLWSISLTAMVAGAHCIQGPSRPSVKTRNGTHCPRNLRRDWCWRSGLHFRPIHSQGCA